jgi:hypothetical protein
MRSRGWERYRRAHGHAWPPHFEQAIELDRLMAAHALA